MRVVKLDIEQKRIIHRCICTGVPVTVTAKRAGVNFRTLDKRLDDVAFLSDLVASVGLTREDWEALSPDVWWKGERGSGEGRRADYRQLILDRFPDLVRAVEDAERIEREEAERARAEDAERRRVECEEHEREAHRRAERMDMARERREDALIRTGSTSEEKKLGLDGAENWSARKAYRLAHGINFGDGRFWDAKTVALMYDARGL